MRTGADRLSDILVAIAKIRERAGGSIGAFDHDEMLQVWVIHHLQVIGEAASGYPGMSGTTARMWNGRKSSRFGTFWSMSTSASTYTRCGRRLKRTCLSWRNRFGAFARTLHPIPRPMGEAVSEGRAALL